MKANPKVVLALAMAAAALAVPGLAQTRPRVVPTVAGLRKPGGKKYRRKGLRECARRRRQIANYQLTEANGLWRAA